MPTQEVGGRYPRKYSGALRSEASIRDENCPPMEAVLPVTRAHTQQTCINTDLVLLRPSWGPSHLQHALASCEAVDARGAVLRVLSRDEALTLASRR